MKGIESNVRWLWLILAIAILVIVPFVLFGEFFTELFALQSTIDWMQATRNLAWLAGILLLIGDIILPIPGTVVMASLGYIYGFWMGAFCSAIGSFAGGLLGCWLCRRYGISIAERIVGKDRFASGNIVLRNSGPWIVAGSRSIPVLSEMSVCMAGLARMPARKFAFALACGVIPMAMVFSWSGSVGVDQPLLAILLNIAIPVVLWGTAFFIVRRKKP